MEEAALVLWLLTAGGGLTMAAIWAARGGLKQRDEVLATSYRHVADATDIGGLPPEGRRSRLPTWMVSTHGALAALGLVLWIYLVRHEGQDGTGVGALPPLTVALLLLVAGLGVLMVRRWREDRERLASAKVPKADRPPEQRIPSTIVAMHGLLAVATLALVVLTAVGIGD